MSRKKNNNVKPNRKTFKPTAKRRLLYSVENMGKAVQAVTAKEMSIVAAAKKFSVPRSTLQTKLHGSPINARHGPSTVLTTKEEKVITDWIFHCAQAGFPITKYELLLSVSRLVAEIKIKDPLRKFPFTNDMPSRHWYEAFLKRHPNIALRVPQNLTKLRAEITKEKIKKWHDEVHQYLTTKNIADILKDPKRVFNADEAAFFLCPKGEKVLCPRGTKSLYSIVNADEKECLTTLINCNAAGDIAPPLIVFQYARVPWNIAELIPESWGVGKSSSGWMTAEVFYEYICNVFFKWLETSQIQRPIILFVDGHTSHQSLHTSEFCDANGIILVALFPNATHMIQPMDVAVFRTLKKSWKEEVKRWRSENAYQELGKRDFAPLLDVALQRSVTPQVVKNGFRKCGIHPWNIDAIDFGKIPTDEGNRDQRGSEDVLEGGNFLEILEARIGKEKISRFEEMFDKDEDQLKEFLDVKDTNLFFLWKSEQIKKSQLAKKADEKKDDGGKSKENEPTENHELPGTSADTSTSFTVTANPTKKGTDPEEIFSEIPEDLKYTLDNLDAFIEEINSQTEEACTTADTEESPTNKANKPTPTETVSDSSLQANSLDKTPVKVAQTPSSYAKSLHTTPDKTTPKKHSCADPVVPSPFKRAFFWPGPKLEKKTRAKDKVPAVTSSANYRAYIKKKEEMKLEAEKLKAERKQQRLAKAAEKESKKKGKQPPKKKGKKVETESEDSEDVDGDLKELSESESETSDLEYSESSFVIVVYEGEYFPGIVLNKKKDGADVRVMQMAGPEDWRWPAEDDILFYDNEDIKAVINPPKIKSARGIYSVPEILAYRRKALTS